MSTLKVENPDLFKGIKFCFIECCNEQIHNAKQLLLDGGATQISYMSDMVTHVISDSDSNSDVSEAKEIFEKPVVTCSWVILSVKCNTLLPEKGFDPDSKQLFSDVVICPSKLSKNDCKILWSLISFNGGKFKLKYDRMCTHLLSTLPQGRKYEKAVERNAKIVTPDWVIDSIKNKEKCDEELYHPRLLILPKSPTPSPPPPPPVEKKPENVVIPTPVLSQANLEISLPNSIAYVHPLRNVRPVNQIISQIQRPAFTTQEVVRVSNTVQQLPRPNISANSVVTTSFSPMRQTQLVNPGRLTSQQQMILKQKWLHQQNANRQVTAARLPSAGQTIAISQRHRMQLPNQQIQVTQTGLGFIQQNQNPGQAQLASQQKVVHQRIQHPNQMNQASTQLQQVQSEMTNPNGTQVPSSQHIQYQQLDGAKNIRMQVPLRQPLAAQQRMQLLQHPHQVIHSQQANLIVSSSSNDPNKLNQPTAVAVNRINMQQQASQNQLTSRQITPQQQQILWQQQQQRPTGRVIIQQGLRQVRYEVQTPGQVARVPQQQQVMWQRRQMLQVRQPLNKVQVAVQQQRLMNAQNVPSHPPPPYPGKNTSQPPDSSVSSTQREPASPQQQIQVSGQQLVNSAGQIVTPKTKTALANLLNTRLQTGTISPNQKEVLENSASQAAKQPPVRGDVNRKKDQVVENTVLIKPTIQLYGHERDIRIPFGSCLLGCTFFIGDYESPFNKVDMWKTIIKYYGGEIEAKYSSHCTHIICENTKNPIMQQALRESKRCITAFWLNDVIIQKNMIPPWKALHIPSPCIHDKPCRHHMIAVSGFDGNDRKCLQEMIQISGAKYTGHMSRLNTLLICKSNEGPKYEKAVEWRIPVVNVQWINDILFGNYEALKCPSAIKYQNFALDNPFILDYTNIHHLMFAWRSPVRIPENLMAQCIDRPPLKTLNTIKDHSLEPPSKRIRFSSNVSTIAKSKPRIMFSGISDASELTAIVLKLGGSIVNAIKECTHLVLKSMMRTVKVLACISTCDFIVTSDWLVESSKQNKFIDEEPFIPDSPDMETTMGFNLKHTLLRKDRNLIFQGYIFYVTPTTPPSFKILCSLIESAGGKIVKKPPKVIEIQSMNKASTKLIVVSSDADVHLCKKFFMNGIAVYNAEIVLTSLMNQHLDLNLFKYKSDITPSGTKLTL